MGSVDFTLLDVQKRRDQEDSEYRRNREMLEKDVAAFSKEKDEYFARVKMEMIHKTKEREEWTNEKKRYLLEITKV